MSHTMTAARQNAVPVTPDENHHNPRLVFVDVLNVVSCIAVLMLHVSLNVFAPERSHAWAQAVAFQAVAIFAVPVFFMVSGMNLLGYRSRYSTKAFIRKRLWRVGKALILASICCYLLFVLFPQAFGTQAYADSFGFIDFTKRFMTNNVNDFYWFLYSIIYLYALTPLLSLAADNKRLMEYLIILTFAFAWGIPLLEHLGVGEQYFASSLNWPLYTSQDLLYFLLGYYLAHHAKLRLPSWAWLLIAACAAAAMFAMALRTNGYFAGARPMPTEYHNYAINGSPIRVVESVAVFMLFAGIEPWLRSLPHHVLGMLRALSGAVLGVYLFHILTLNWLATNVHGAFGEALTRFPLLRLAIIYVVTTVIVIVGKILIAKGMAILPGKPARNHNQRTTRDA